MSKDYPWGKGTPKRAYDSTANDSDKAFTVPAGKVWVLNRVAGELITTATVGNRFLQIQLTDGTNLLWTRFTAAVVASKSAVIDCYDGVPNSTTVAKRFTTAGTPDIAYSESIPKIILPAGYVVRVWDSAAIDAAADDLTVLLHYVEYDA